jgi:hypothetical protein
MVMTIRGRQSTWDPVEFKQNKFFGDISDMVAESRVALGARIVTKLKMDGDAEMLLNLSGLRCFFVPFGGPNGAPIWAVHKSDARLRAESDFMPDARQFTLPLNATYAQWLTAIGDYIDARRDKEVAAGE